MPAEPLVDPALWNLDRPILGKDEIRKVNLQRFEMEQLDAITQLDAATMSIVGFRDVRGDEFWVRGHVPGRPILPGVLMLEALAQITSFYIGKAVPDVGFIGFGGVDGVKFRRTVVPGQRLVLVGKGVEIRSRRAVFDTQGWVEGKLAVEARITGVKV